MKTQLSSVRSLSRVRLFATPWTAARQASLSITNSRSLLKLTSIESVLPKKKINKFFQEHGISLVAQTVKHLPVMWKTWV